MRQAVRERILKLRGRRCAYCGATEKLQIDHRIPLSKGGKHDEDNLQVLCKTCNLKKGNKFALERYIKIGIDPDYILIDKRMIETFCGISPKELTEVIELKFEENDRFFKGRYNAPQS